MAPDHLIKQVSMFSENKPGRLAVFAKAMESEGIDILAFSIAEAEGFGVIRALVSDPEKAYGKLISQGFMVRMTDVIGVRMKDRPGGLREVADILGDSGINIDYSYAFTGKHGAILVLRVDRVDDAVQKFLARGIPLLENKDIL